LLILGIDRVGLDGANKKHNLDNPSFHGQFLSEPVIIEVTLGNTGRLQGMIEVASVD
jgi:hypothetical protein